MQTKIREKTEKLIIFVGYVMFWKHEYSKEYINIDGSGGDDCRMRVWVDPGEITV